MILFLGFYGLEFFLKKNFDWIMMIIESVVVVGWERGRGVFVCFVGGSFFKRKGVEMYFVKEEGGKVVFFFFIVSFVFVWVVVWIVLCMIYIDFYFGVEGNE